MNEDITTAVTVIENTVQPTFEDAWQNFTEKRDTPVSNVKFYPVTYHKR